MIKWPHTREPSSAFDTRCVEQTFRTWNVFWVVTALRFTEMLHLPNKRNQNSTRNARTVKPVLSSSNALTPESICMDLVWNHVDSRFIRTIKITKHDNKEKVVRRAGSILFARSGSTKHHSKLPYYVPASSCFIARRIEHKQHNNY